MTFVESWSIEWTESEKDDETSQTSDENISTDSTEATHIELE
jgi:hypothetical protein